MVSSAFERCKSQVKAQGLNGPGKVRVNKAGCMDRCAAGPVAVVYPGAVWYTYVDAHDIDEIVESHLKNGRVVGDGPKDEVLTAAALSELFGSGVELLRRHGYYHMW